MKKLLQSLFVLMLVAISAMAQQRTITGTVTGQDDGKPLPGVNIRVKGSSLGTSSGADGRYSLSVPSTAKELEFSYIGYTAQARAIGASGVINVSLVMDAKELGEVVVVAYGQQTKRSVIGSVSGIKADDIQGQKIVSATQALQGTVPGVRIVNNTGQPGESPQIRVRGITSINASSAPLIVVDGVAFDDVNGTMASINPNDIESMNVLKDATSAALYGSRAAGGVILITTKTGKYGQAPSINFSTGFGSSSRAVSEYPFLNSAQYMNLAWEALKNQGKAIGSLNPGQYATDNLIDQLKYNPYGVAKPIDANGNLVPGAALLWDTDWSKELTRNHTYRKEYALSISGGTDKSKYFVSGSYLDQDGYAITSGYKRANVRVNYTNKVTNWLELGVKSAISSSTQNFPTQSGSAFANVIQYIRTMSSIYPLYQHDDKGGLIKDINGNPILDYGGPIPGRTVNVKRPVLSPSNLVGTTNLDNIINKTFLSTTNVYGEATILPELKFRTNYALDKNFYTNSSYQNPDFGDAAAVGGRVSKERDVTTSWTLNNMLTFNKQIGDHSIEAMASMEAYNYSYEYLYASRTGFPFGGLEELTPGTVNETTDSELDQTTLLSYLARVAYNYKGKYFLEGTFRSDKSSKFSPKKRVGYFPSVGASWLLSEEDFLKSDRNPFSFLKLRASYGSLGNNNLLNSLGGVDYFPYLPLYTAGKPDLGQPGILLSSIGNANISWEKSTNANLGLDFGLFKDRLTGTVEVFYNKTSGLLFNRPLVQSGGIATYPDNIGTMRNRGIELTLNSVNIKNTNFSWTSNLNLSVVRNKILSLSQPSIIVGSYNYSVGHTPFDFYIEEWAGVDPQDGAPMWYKDVTTNGVTSRVTTKNYSEANRVYSASAMPKLTGGFSNRFDYKGIDFSFLVNFSIGGKIYDSDYIGLMNGFSAMGNQLSADELKRWQKPGDITDVPVLNVSTTNAGTSRSTRFLMDASYLRLRNVALGYTLTPKVLHTTDFFKSMRIYIQADNALTWYNGNKGLDPEQTIGGLTNNRTSTFKTYSVGLNVTF